MCAFTPDFLHAGLSAKRAEESTVYHRSKDSRDALETTGNRDTPTPVFAPVFLPEMTVGFGYCSASQGGRLLAKE